MNSFMHNMHYSMHTMHRSSKCTMHTLESMHIYIYSVILYYALSMHMHSMHSSSTSRISSSSSSSSRYYAY